MCTCDEEYRLTREEQCAISHWHSVKRSVLRALLDDESDTLIQASQAVEHCKREIQRLDKTIAGLDHSTHGQARGRAIERRQEYQQQLQRFGPQAGAGAQIVEWLKQKIAEQS